MKKGTKTKQGYVIERKTYSVQRGVKSKTKNKTEYVGYEVNWLPSGTEVRFYDDGRATLRYAFPFEIDLPTPIAEQARAVFKNKFIYNDADYLNETDFGYTKVAAKRVKKVEGRKTR